MQKCSQEQGTVVGGQGKEIQDGQMGDKKFGDEVGQECSISRGGPDSTVEVYVPEESEEGGVTVLRQGGKLQK